MGILPSQESLQKQLMEVFKFDQYDLLSNKNGTLSANQKKRISNNGWLLFSVFSLVGLFFAVLLVVSSKKPLHEFPWIVPIMMLFLFLILGIALAWVHWRTCLSGHVTRYHGIVECKTVNGKLFLHIEKMQLRLFMNVSPLFEENAAYDIYYAPLIATIMSVEKTA